MSEETSFSKEDLSKIRGWLTKGFLMLAIVVLLLQPLFSVGTGERGIVTTFGEPNMVPYSEGLHLKIPFIQNVVIMDVKTQKLEAQASAASKDLQVVTAEITINYRLIPEDAPKVFKQVGLNYREKVISPALQESVKATTAKFTAEELITQRDAVKEAIKESLQSKMLERSVQVEAVSITNFDFSASFNTAIEQKVTAQQNKLKAENDLARIEVEARQAEAVAIGKRNAAIAEAEGMKNSSILRAQGEAQAIELVNAQLARSESYINYIKAKSWDGKLPTYVGGESPMLLLGINGGNSTNDKQ